MREKSDEGLKSTLLITIRYDLGEEEIRYDLGEEEGPFMSRAGGFHATGGKTGVATSGAPRDRSAAYAAGGSGANASVSLEFGLPLIRALRTTRVYGG